jgi:hypothetical protein
MGQFQVEMQGVNHPIKSDKPICHFGTYPDAQIFSDANSDFGYM